MGMADRAGPPPRGSGECARQREVVREGAAAHGRNQPGQPGSRPAGAGF